MPEVLYVTAPRHVELRTEPDRDLKPHEARVRMVHSGMSHGTELHFYSGRGAREFPDTTGYSAVGEIVEAGREFTSAKIGETIFDYVGHCTEFVVSEDQPLYKLPNGLEPRNGIFAALAGVALNGVLESQVALGETAVVFGLGVVGQFVAAFLKRSGAFKVIGVDPIPKRREASLLMGADVILDPTDGSVEAQVREANGGELADVVIETSGAAAGLNAAINVVQPQSVIVALSLYGPDASGVDLSGAFHRRRVQIRVAQGDSTPVYLSPRWDADRRLRTAIDLLPELPLSGLITHSFPLDRAQEAYEFVLGNAGECIQVVFEYPTEAER